MQAGRVSGNQPFKARDRQKKLGTCRKRPYYPPVVNTETSHRCMKLGLLSCRSRGTRLTWLWAIYVSYNGIDLMALTETWLSPRDGDRLIMGHPTPVGYSFHHKPRWRGGGGLAFLVKSGLTSAIGSSSVVQLGSFEHMAVRLSLDQRYVPSSLWTIRPYKQLLHRGGFELPCGGYQ